MLRLSVPNPETRIRAGLSRSLISLSVIGLLMAPVLVPPLRANPNRVADLNTAQSPVDDFFQSPSSEGGAFSPTGEFLFAGFDPFHGDELWATDGTEIGTRLLFDLRPGQPSGAPRDLMTADGVTFFTSFGPSSEKELWQTDGTAEGTVRLLTLGRGTSITQPTWDGTQLFVVVTRPSIGRELAVWDGMALHELEVLPGAASAEATIQLVAPGGGVFFSATTPETGEELFFSDGTAIGTDLVVDANLGTASSSPRGLTFVTSKVLAFTAVIAGGGREIAAWDFDSETLTPLDIRPGPDSSSPASLTALVDRLYYIADNQTDGRELWEYFPFLGLNLRRTDIAPGSADGVSGNLAVLGTSDLYFAGSDPTTGSELWNYDVLDGASLVQNTLPGLDGVEPDNLTAIDGILYYAGKLADGAVELYRSDGTDGGTGELADFNPMSSNSSFPLVLESVGGRLLVFLGQVDFESGYLLSALVAVTGLNTWEWLSAGVTTSSSSPGALTPDGDGGLRFTGFVPSLGKEPYAIDGSGLHLIEDVVLGPGSLNPVEYLVMRDQTLMRPHFSTTDAPPEPYRWDGNSVAQINLLGSGDSQPTNIVRVGDYSVARARDSASSYILYGIDPVTLDTEVLTASTVKGLLIPAGDTLFFLIGDELWKTDGTSSGTELVKDLNGATVNTGAALLPGDGPTLPRIVLVTQTFPELAKLWVSDGTTGGTVVIDEGHHDYVIHLRVSGARALYHAYLGGTGTRELFVTDGTPVGSVQLTDRDGAGDFNTTPIILGAISAGWFYRDSRASTGLELWFTDGATTTMLEVNPGPAHSLTATAGAGLGDQFIVSIFTPERGSELWQSNGTPAGTRPLPEIVPGPEGQDVVPVASGNRVYFSAIRSLEEGRELWYWEAPLFADGFESGDTSAWSVAP